MALALYRRFRPKQFKDVIDQTDIATALKNQVAAGKISHAYLFTGIRGTGKTTLARILAKAVNCKHTVDGEPCGVCEICTGIDNGSILDVTEIDAASNNGVDNIRDLRDETAYIPAVADKRVYIIDEVHMLSTGAFNALLKIMEEPPEHVMFILATTEIHKVPATILSRCQRFDLKRISAGAIAGYLLEVAKEENWTLTPGAAAMIARLADGAMRDALSILDTCASLGETIDETMVRRFSGGANRDYLFSLADTIADGDIAAAMKQIDELYSDSVNPVTLTGELLAHFRDLLMIKVGGSEVLAEHSTEEVARCETQASRFSKDEMLASLKSLKELATSLPNAVDKRLQLELYFIELCGNAVLGQSVEGSHIVKTAQRNFLRPEAVKQQAGQTALKERAIQGEPQEDIPPWDVDVTSEPRPQTGPETSEAAAEKKDDETPLPDVSAQIIKEEPPSELDGQVGFEVAPPQVDDLKEQQRSNLPEEDMPPWDESGSSKIEVNENVATSAQPIEEVSLLERVAQPLTESGEMPQDGAFLEWPRVIEAMKRKNGMLYGFMLGSSAYHTPTHILIDCSESFKEQLREKKEYADAIKEVIAEVTGFRMPIGPYNREDAGGEPPKDDPLEQLVQLAKENDIPVDIK